MSNSEAARLYESIIEEVTAESRQDFEDSGIDESTLQDLRKIWRNKLSESGVAEFSWTQNTKEEFSQQQQQQQQQLRSGDLQSNFRHQIDPLAGIQDIQIPNDIQLPTITPKNEDSGLEFPGMGQTDGAGKSYNFELHIDATPEQVEHMRRRLGKRQVDGPGSDNDNVNDSDDINSDLDDTDDDEINSDDDNDEQEDNIMLCLYDRVQRVRNKWKCNLRDGIVNMDGRDYTFQKATGESEW
ncbi:Transcription initiation factor IIA large subunit [Komagataella phaffii CBS 7435]|uniref:Transcription initiation factor IIA large subunit n=2 Tax=Komagataella phaffii TaxID=460519 RepID=C4R067_KOMPG|nr:TFIIA large subunit [Komagataella phaffii GS115]AOA67717.1 GQ68_01080T0 [Komagataella phaffii GS115]CAH2448606.1 Putative transcription initiation factor IIA large subunit [Komagataella phaffii CBS 7435]CAY68891.1 TFIIA large subunit [Komagataella phaffii GS115]CCA38707.1 Transcription initiation factor IIA large subunit [Komagataella phaffii CBS 7435]